MNNFEIAKLEIKARIAKVEIELKNVINTINDCVILEIDTPKKLEDNALELKNILAELKDMYLDVCVAENKTRIKPVPSAVYHNESGNVVVEY